MNWNQTGMPSALVSRLGQRREIAEFKSVLCDVQNHIQRPVDVESMAQELMESGGRDFVEMVKELTVALEIAKRELVDANQRYERLVADLQRRGVSLEAERPLQVVAEDAHEEPPKDLPSEKSKSSADELAEWEEWDRRFRALLG